MNDESKRLLDKAKRSIRAAEILKDASELEFAMGRAYYALFYTASALLANEGIKSTKHAGIHALFANRFIRSGRLDFKYHRFLLDAFDRRLQADYGFDFVLDAADLETTIKQARDFLLAAETLLD